MSDPALVLAALGPLAFSSDGDAPIWLLLFGPAGAVAFYTATWRAYRNTDKSHRFERETEVVVSNLTGSDVKVDEIKGTRERWIRGRNSHTPRTRIGRR